MADNSTSENSGKKITVTVKTPKEKQGIEIDQDATIKQVFHVFMISHFYIEDLSYLKEINVTVQNSQLFIFNSD